MKLRVPERQSAIVKLAQAFRHAVRRRSQSRHLVAAMCCARATLAGCDSETVALCLVDLTVFASLVHPLLFADGVRARQCEAIHHRHVSKLVPHRTYAHGAPAPVTSGATDLPHILRFCTMESLSQILMRASQRYNAPSGPTMACRLSRSLPPAMSSCFCFLPVALSVPALHRLHIRLLSMST